MEDVKDVAEVKICPYCGSEIPLYAAKCKNCGEWLEEELATGPSWIISVIAWILGLFGFIVSNSAWGWIACSLFLELYFYPTRLAIKRRFNFMGTLIVLLVNLFFGYTIVGWFVALGLANARRS